MNADELKKIDEKVNKLAIGIALHLETIHGQIGDRIDQIDKEYTDRFVKINSLLERT